MAKKINCKDGLDHKEELQARRIRWNLENGDEVEIQKVLSLYKEWFEKPKESFIQWLYNNDNKVLSSALKRMADWTIIIK